MSGKPIYEQQGVAMTCRSFEEYVSMFALEEETLAKGAILDVAAGASSFVAEANARGYEALAVDPMYELDPNMILRKGLKEIEESTAKLANLKERFDWSYYGNIATHQANREKSLKKFISDYRVSKGLKYVAGQLPLLPFPDERFELVLCSHFLFLYGGQFSYEFHKEAISEMLRVCGGKGRVLIYPLVSLRFEQEINLTELIKSFVSDGIEANYIRSKLPFIPGSTELLSLTKK